jgi:hypothetical protein
VSSFAIHGWADPTIARGGANVPPLRQPLAPRDFGASGREASNSGAGAGHDRPMQLVLSRNPNQHFEFGKDLVRVGLARVVV